MKATIQPYLFFGGRCEEAIEFYRQVLDAQIEMLMRFEDSPEPVPADQLQPGFENKIMHCSFRIGESLLMASDGCGDNTQFNGFSLSLTLNTAKEAECAFTALAEGGEISMPLSKTFWSPCFGMVKDRFGINWMVTIPPQ